MVKVIIPEDNTLEPGTYYGTFEGVEERESGQFGPFWRWKVRVEDVEVSGVSSAKATRKTKGRAWAEAVMGRPLGAGDEVDFESLVGRPVTVKVELDDNGFARIADILPAIKQTAPAAATELQAFAEASAEADDLPF